MSTSIDINKRRENTERTHRLRSETHLVANSPLQFEERGQSDDPEIETTGSL
jgi:hypothetical protein